MLTQLLLGRVRTDAFEEHADLGLPALQVGAQDRSLLLVVELDGREADRCASRPAGVPHR